MGLGIVATFLRCEPSRGFKALLALGWLVIAPACSNGMFSDAPGTRTGSRAEDILPPPPAVIMGVAWQTVDDVSVLSATASNTPNIANALTITAGGDIYVTGILQNSLNSGATTVRKVSSSDLDKKDWKVSFHNLGFGSAISTDSSGNVYALGNSPPNYCTPTFTIARSKDAGQTWSDVDSAVERECIGLPTRAIGVFKSRSNGLIAIGHDNGRRVPFNGFIVRASASGDDGTWTTISSSPRTDEFPQSAFQAPNGDIYMSGYRRITYDYAWWLRRSQDDGVTWSDLFVDYQVIPGLNSYGQAAALAQDGTLYAVGGAILNSDTPLSPISAWIVRKSQDGGVTWTTLPQFQLNSGSAAGAFGIAISPKSQKIYVAGSARDSFGNNHAIVRASDDAGKTWTIEDNYQLSPDSDSSYTAISITPGDRIVAVGQGNSSHNSVTHWITRAR